MVMHLNAQISNCELITSTFVSDELRSQNPLGKIPALCDDDRQLFDSALICEYLIDKAEQNGTLKHNFYQRNTKDYYDIQTAYVLANGITEASVSTVMENFRKTEQSKHWLDRWDKAIKAAIAQTNIDYLGSATSPNIASLAMISALGYLDFRLAGYDWRPINPKLATWYKTVAKEPWAVSTAPK